MSDVASSHAARRELWISHQHEGGLGAPLHNDHAESRPPLTADHQGYKSVVDSTTNTGRNAYQDE